MPPVLTLLSLASGSSTPARPFTASCCSWVISHQIPQGAKDPFPPPPPPPHILMHVKLCTPNYRSISKYFFMVKVAYR